MIEQLAEHGVTSEDLVPSLVATYTIDNPEYDPEAAELAAHEGDIALELDDGPEVDAARQREREEQSRRAGAEQARREREERERAEEDVKIAAGADAQDLEDRLGDMALASGDDEDENDEGRDLGYVRRQVREIERRASEVVSPPTSPRSPMTAAAPSPSSPRTPTKRGRSMFDALDDDGGDIGGALDSPSTPSLADSPKSPHPDYPSPLPDADAPPPAPSPPLSDSDSEPPTPRASSPAPPAYDDAAPETRQPNNFLDPLPSSLPGVSKTLTSLDKTVTLDIRWTILCDLFLALIADSVYDARSRVLLGCMAEKLGLDWMDVVRFERRLTEALEIQEAVKDKKHDEVLEGRRLKDKQKRLLLMGAATVGGGLVIGLSAGLLAPFIGAGLGAALATVGVSGTSGFLAGAGGAAIISSGATLTGATIGGKAMAKRTKHVQTFDIQPVHNNKRLNVFLTVSGRVLLSPPPASPARQDAGADGPSLLTSQVHERHPRRRAPTLQHDRPGHGRRPLGPVGARHDGRHRASAQHPHVRGPHPGRAASARRNRHDGPHERAPVADECVPLPPGPPRLGPTRC